jgi:hypothetical protein
MFVLALLLIAVALVLTTGVVSASTASASLEIFMVSVPATVATVFLTGVITGFAFLLGLWLLKIAAKQSRKRRTERRTLEQEHRRQMTELESKLMHGSPPESPNDPG